MEPLGDARAYLERCKARKEQGDYQGAIADCDDALRLDPSFAAAYSLRGSLRLLQRDAAGAIADCDEALKANPRLVEAYTTRALARQLRGEIKEALADSSHAIDVDPENALSYMVRSGVRTAQGDITAAMDDFQKAVRLDPTVANPLQKPATRDSGLSHSPDEPRDAAGYIRRAMQRREAGSLPEAVVDCTEALKLDPQAADAFIVRGMTRQDQGYLDRAIADYDRAIQIKPQHSQAYLLKGRLRGAQGQLDEARAEYDKALEADPNNTLAYTYRAQVRAARSDTDGAIGDCNRALEIDSRNAEAYLARAAARWEQGDLERALRDCDEAILLDPNDGKAYLLRGNIRQTKGDEQGAVEDFQLAVKVDGSLADAFASEEQATARSEEALVPAIVATADNEVPQAEDHGPTLPMSPGGPRSWIVTAAIHGGLAGVVYGLISGGFTSIALALLLFTPFLLNLFLGRRIGTRNAVLGGLILAAAGIALHLALVVDLDPPFIRVTGELPAHVSNLICWILAWGMFGTFVAVFVGTSRMGGIIRSIQGNMPRAMRVARRGAVAGLLIGTILAGLYRLLPGGYSGGVAGLAVGLILGGVAGSDRWGVLFAMLGMLAGGYYGSLDDEAVYRVIGAGLGSGVYWAIGGAAVGVFAGASVGSRTPARVAEGPLFQALFAHAPVPAGKGFNFATGLLAAVGGLFSGGSVGSVAGFALGALVEVPNEPALPWPWWAGAGAVLGGVIAVLFSGRIAYYDGPDTGGVPEPMTVPLDLRSQVLVVLAGVVAGMVLALLAWLGTQAQPGTLLYWALGGAGVGAAIGVKLWTFAEK